jgi:hypothetical protein
MYVTTVGSLPFPWQLYMYDILDMSSIIMSSSLENDADKQKPLRIQNSSSACMHIPVFGSKVLRQQKFAHEVQCLQLQFTHDHKPAYLICSPPHEGLAGSIADIDTIEYMPVSMNGIQDIEYDAEVVEVGIAFIDWQ